MITDAAKFSQRWTQYVNNGELENIVALYHEAATLMPTFSPHVLNNKAAIKDYFVKLSAKEGLVVTLHEDSVEYLPIHEKSYVINGFYDFTFNVDDQLLTFPSRFTFVIDLARENPILHHHSSQMPRTLG